MSAMYPTMRWRALAVAAAIGAASVVGGLQASAQQRNQGPPNALQGFSQNRDLPVKIQAAALEFRDKDNLATFSGDVRVLQGDTEMRCRSMVVHFETDPRASGMKTAEPGPSGQQQIRRIEAKGGVVVTQKDQSATGDTGVFDMRSNTVTLIGNVIVTRGQDVLRGQRLVVDLTSGTSKMDQGRVEGMFQAGGRNPEKK